MTLRKIAFLAPLAVCAAFGQTYTIATVAGSAPQVNVAATAAILGGRVVGVAPDASGNLYFSGQDSIRMVSASTGTLTLVVGNGTAGFSGDGGPASSAQVNDPHGVAIDPTGNLYFADYGNNRVRKVSNGIVTTVAGNGTEGFSGDNGPATSAELDGPTGIALDAAGNLYITDQTNNRIRKVSGGVITTVAGNGTAGFSGDNSGNGAINAELKNPSGVAVDSSGNLYIADTGNNRIRKVSGGVISTVAGNGNSNFSGDSGQAVTAGVYEPNGVAVDSAGNIYIADAHNYRVRKVTVSSGVIATIAGNGTPGFGGDNGLATVAELHYPVSVALDSSGNLYIADLSDAVIRKVASGVITTVAGMGTSGFGGDQGPATSALFDTADGIAIDAAGNLYIADLLNTRIRQVSAGGVINTIAGDSIYGYAGDGGPALSAELDEPISVILDASGNIYFSDTLNNRVRKISNGVITTVAGNGTEGFSGDNGPAASAELDDPTGLALDSSGNLYIADRKNNRIREVSGGIISTVAGNGTEGFSGDNGPAIGAELTLPQGVAVDNLGNLYISDTLNYRIRKVSGGTITTIAGTGKTGYSGDNGPATSAMLSNPLDLALDAAGSIYFVDGASAVIRKITSGVISTIAGNGTSGLSGDGGPATAAQLNGPFGIALSNGNVYVADGRNNRIRMLTPVAGSTCGYSISPASVQVSAAGGNVAVSIQTTAACAWTVTGLPSWITIPGASSGTGPGTVTLVVAPNSGAVLGATISIAGISFTVAQAGVSGTAGGSTITSVGTASGGSNIAQNTFIVIKGTNLVPATTPAAGMIWSTAPSFASGQMPTQLGSVSVTVNGKAAYIYFFCSAVTSQVCTSDQINVLTPLDSTTGAVQIVVTSGTTASSPYAANMTAVSPAFLLFGSSSYVAATHLNYTLIGPSSLYPGASTPAQPGEQVVIYAVGFGLPSTPLVAGSASQSGSLATLPVCTVGSNAATVAFAGVISPGLYQLNLVIPAATSNGDQPIACAYNGATTPAGDLITVN